MFPYQAQANTAAHCTMSFSLLTNIAKIEFICNKNIYKSTLSDSIIAQRYFFLGKLQYFNPHNSIVLYKNKLQQPITGLLQLF